MWQAAKTANSPTKLATLRQEDKQTAFELINYCRSTSDFTIAIYCRFNDKQIIFSFYTFASFQPASQIHIAIRHHIYGQHSNLNHNSYASQRLLKAAVAAWPFMKLSV